jgi:predicted DNA-binding transcriptional regulator AlpA
MPEKLVEPKEIAEYLGLPVTTLSQWRYLGTGPRYVKVGPRCVRYRWSEITAWLDSRTATR